MSPRRLGASWRIVVWANASGASRSRWPTCQYARRVSSDAATTANVTRRNRRRRRESVRPSIVDAVDAAQRPVRTSGSPSWPRPASRDCFRIAGSRPRRFRSDSSSCLRVTSVLALGQQPVDVVAGRRDADRLGEREEREHERDRRSRRAGPTAGWSGDGRGPRRGSGGGTAPPGSRDAGRARETAAIGGGRPRRCHPSRPARSGGAACADP